MGGRWNQAQGGQLHRVFANSRCLEFWNWLWTWNRPHWPRLDNYPNDFFLLSARLWTIKCAVSHNQLLRFTLPVLQLTLHNGVTITGGVFQPLPVHNSDAATCIGDQSCLLQCARSYGDA